MTVFHDVFTRAAAATKEVRRLSDLEYRWVLRYRLWECHEDLKVRRSAARLSARRRAAIEAAEAAEHRLNDVWDALSRAVVQQFVLTEADGYIRETSADAAADLVELLLRDGTITDPDRLWWPGAVDARVVIASTILRLAPLVLG
jgi:hypothetical protein